MDRASRSEPESFRRTIPKPEGPLHGPSMASIRGSIRRAVGISLRKSASAQRGTDTAKRTMAVVHRSWLRARGGGRAGSTRCAPPFPFGMDMLKSKGGSLWAGMAQRSGPSVMWPAPARRDLAGTEADAPAGGDCRRREDDGRCGALDRAVAVRSWIRRSTSTSLGRRSRGADRGVARARQPRQA